MGLNYVGPLIHRYFPINSVFYDFINISSFIVRTQYITHVTKYVNQLCYQLRVPVNNQLLVVKLLKNQKLYVDF